MTIYVVWFEWTDGTATGRHSCGYFKTHDGAKAFVDSHRDKMFAWVNRYGEPRVIERSNGVCADYSAANRTAWVAYAIEAAALAD